MNRYLVLVTAVSIGVAFPAHAEPSYRTPEYSGPSAQLDRKMDDYRDSSDIRLKRELGERDIQRMRANDRAFDAETQRRWSNTQIEMDRRRDEVRRLGKFND